MKHLYPRRLIRLCILIRKDERMPRWLKWTLAVALAPWPGPLDEVALVPLLGIVGVRYPHVIRDAWRGSR